MEFFLILWLGWCLGNLFLMWRSDPNVPAYTGFKIIMPTWLNKALTSDEWTAVMLHELGHMYYKHTWKNYAMVCVFAFPSKKRILKQEQEADAYAISQGATENLLLSARSKMKKYGG